jgi:iron(III) transport system ATP-binding protein
MEKNVQGGGRVSSLEIQSLTVNYVGGHGTVAALTDFSLSVREGGLTVLLGESGCGKSTALNSVAGLTQPNAGRISLGGDVLFESKGRRPTIVPPEKRNVGMVFQSYALWPHLSVVANVIYPLSRRSVGKEEAERRAREALTLVRCDTLAQRFPGELSGGQQQRVALARALVGRPKLLLFDEPLSNLDASLRRNLRDELGRLHKELGFTGLYVTHDQTEALALGTEIAVMNKGRIVQSGRPHEIYEQPETEFVARFFGANVVRGRATGNRVATSIGEFERLGSNGEGDVMTAIMPHNLVLEARSDGPLTVIDIMYVGSHREIRLAASDGEVLAIQPSSEVPPSLNARVTARAAPINVRTFVAG